MVTDGERTESDGSNESNKKRTGRSKKEGNTNLEKGLGICQMCGNAEAKWIDSSKPLDKWKVCEECVKISSFNPSEDKVAPIVIMEEE